jgi:hypothetical protein
MGVRVQRGSENHSEARQVRIVMMQWMVRRLLSCIAEHIFILIVQSVTVSSVDSELDKIKVPEADERRSQSAS